MTSNMTFWERNEGTLLGTLGGILIAILAAFLTLMFSQYKISKKEKENYQGLLYTLHAELYWHDHHFKLLKNTLLKLKTASIKKQEFVLLNSPMQFNLSITETILLKAVEYKHYKHELIALLTSYLNQMRDINYFLDFSNANELLIKTENGINNGEIISDYFTVLENQYIEKTQPVISDMRKIIESELKNYPKEKMVLTEN